MTQPNSKILALLTLCAVALPARSSVASFDSAAIAAPMVGAEKQLRDEYAKRSGGDVPALKRQLDGQVDAFIAAPADADERARRAYADIFLDTLRQTLRSAAGDSVSDEEFKKIGASPESHQPHISDVLFGACGFVAKFSAPSGNYWRYSCFGHEFERETASERQRRRFAQGELRETSRAALDWLVENRAFLKIRERSHADSSLVLAGGGVNPQMLAVVNKLQAEQSDENVRRRVRKQPPLNRDFGLFSTDGEVVMTWEQARTLLADKTTLRPAETLPKTISGFPTQGVLDWDAAHRPAQDQLTLTPLVHGPATNYFYDSAQLPAILKHDAAFLARETLPAAIAGFPAAGVFDWLAAHLPAGDQLTLTPLVHEGVKNDFYDSEQLTAIQDWAALHKTALRDALAHPEERIYIVGGDAAGVILGAVQKIAAAQGVDAESLVLRDPSGIVVSVRTVKETMRRAYGAVAEGELPPGIEGFPTQLVLRRAQDWLGDDGLAAFRYVFDIGSGQTVYYNLPMLKIWAFENKTLLDRVINKNWPLMPVEKATLWTAQELAVRKNVPVDDVVSATPKQVYISLALYPEFMAIYRVNKQTLTGEEIAGALQAFSQQLAGSLAGIRQSIESLDMNTTARLGDINLSIGALPAQISADMDLSLMFGRRVWGRR